MFFKHRVGEVPDVQEREKRLKRLVHLGETMLRLGGLTKILEQRESYETRACLGRAGTGESVQCSIEPATSQLSESVAPWTGSPSGMRTISGGDKGEP
jgi:hypothetical protein